VAYAPLAILAPFCTILARNGTFPDLLQSCCFPGLELCLSDGLMLQSRIWGKGYQGGAFSGWLPPGVGAGMGNAMMSDCFQAYTGLRTAGVHK